MDVSLSKTSEETTEYTAGKGNGSSRYLTSEPPMASVGGWSPTVAVEARSPAICRTAVDLELIIPAKNEEDRIGRTLATVSAYLAGQPLSSRIVVVNNGSADRTSEAVDRMAGGPVPVVVIGCSVPGKGAAVRRGVLTSNASYVGFCDADLATPIDALGAVLPLLQDGVDVVVGSRHAPGSKIQVRQSLVRQIGGWAFRRSARSVVPAVHDTQCGFKFFRTAAARQIFSRAWVDDFAFDVEILALASDLGLNIFEAPVAWSDQDNSSFSSLHDGLGSFRTVLALGRDRAGQ
jgi:glycosyltransferase involved in cell wall biosynthesis